MTDYPTTTARFMGEDLTILHKDGELWLTAEQAGRALGLKHERIGATKLFLRNQDEFEEGVDYAYIERVPSLGTGAIQGPKRVRAFSPTGCMLLGMFARTARAAAFRRWAKHLLARGEGDDAAAALAGELLRSRPLWRRISYYREFSRWDRKLTNAEIARLVGLHPSTLRRHLRRMEALGLIQRSRDYEKHRAMITHLRKDSAA